MIKFVDVFKVYRSVRQAQQPNLESISDTNRHFILLHLNELSTVRYHLPLKPVTTQGKHENRIISLDSPKPAGISWLAATQAGDVYIFTSVGGGNDHIVKSVERTEDHPPSVNVIKPYLELNVCNSIKNFNGSNRQQCRTLQCCAYMSNENRGILTYTSSNELQVWDIEYTYRLKNGAINHNPVVSVKLSPQGICYDSFRRMHHFSSNAICQCPEQSLCNSSVVGCCVGRSIQLVDLRIGHTIAYLTKEIEADPGVRTVVRWNPCRSQELVSGTSSGLLDCWDIRKAGGSSLFSFSRSRMESRLFPVDERLALLRGELASGPPASPKFCSTRSCPIANVQFVFAGQYLLSFSFQSSLCAAGEAIQLWDATNGAFCPIYFPLPKVFNQPFYKSLPIAANIACTGRGRELVCCGFHNTVTFYEPLTGSLLYTCKTSTNFPISALNVVPAPDIAYLNCIPQTSVALLTGSIKGDVSCWGI